MTEQNRDIPLKGIQSRDYGDAAKPVRRAERVRNRVIDDTIARFSRLLRTRPERTAQQFDAPYDDSISLPKWWRDASVQTTEPAAAWQCHSR